MPIWNSQSDHIVRLPKQLTLKNHLHRFWSNQDVLYDYRADLIGIGNHTIVMQLFSPLGKLANRAIYFACINFFFFSRQIISGSTGQIFTIFFTK